MFGRKRIRELETEVEELNLKFESLKEAIEAERKERKNKDILIVRACKDDVELLDLRYRLLANREARHEMDVKERLDEYATAILANERDIRALAERGERRTISDMVNEQADMDKASTARIFDEWLNGEKEGTDDE